MNYLQIEKNIVGHPTGFIARKKSPLGAYPKISFLAEYDALPNLGHACGHNIIGSISLAGAIALGETLKNTSGEIIVFGCPAEEGGENGSAKGSFVRENLFKDIDVAMIIHPGTENLTTGKSLAVNPLDFEFFGTPAHASGCPEKGKNALDALLHFFNGIATLRQHLTPDIKIHGIITHGGDAPNIIPSYTKARFYIRAATKEGCDEVTEKVVAIAKGAATMTGCKEKVSSFQNRVDNVIPTPIFDDFYVDVNHKLRHNATRMYGVYDGTKLVAMAMTVAESNNGAVLGAVSCHPDYRKHGYGSTVVKYISNRLIAENKTVYLHRAKNANQSFYNNLGFEQCGSWQEYYFER